MRSPRSSFAACILALALPLACGGREVGTEMADAEPGAPAPNPSSAWVTDSSVAAPAPSNTNAQAAASVGGSNGMGTSAAAASASVTEQAIMDRWNAAATAAGTAIDFHWSAYEQFPHPTFKGGTEEAYGEFADVLLFFFQMGDDFEFLAQGHLFTTPLRYVFPSGGVGIDTTFEQLAAEFSPSTSFGNASPATRQALAGFLARMQ